LDDDHGQSREMIRDDHAIWTSLHASMDP